LSQIKTEEVLAKQYKFLKLSSWDSRQFAMYANKGERGRVRGGRRATSCTFSKCFVKLDHKKTLPDFLTTPPTLKNLKMTSED
jgi:hypothetical protein